MRDGMQYFHVCPREDSPTADGPQHPGEDHRDERPLPGPDAPAGSIRAEGAGRELLEV